MVVPLLVVALLATVCVITALRGSLKRLEARELKLEQDTLLYLQSLIPEGKDAASARNTPVVLITGANSGIGFALASKLYRLGFHVIMGCRNEARGNAARAAILEEAGTANEDRLHLILVDVASLKSVDVFCKQVKARFTRIDFLFCNAGVLNTASFNWMTALNAFLRCRLLYFLETGRAFPNGSHFLVQRDVTLTDDVVDDVFATHVLGHFAMVRWLLPELKRSKGRVIWTGSRAACRDALSIQPGVGGAPSLRDPYASAKCAQDLVSFAIDQHERAAGVRSAIICPGFVDTDVAPAFFRLFRPLLMHLRLVAHNFQVTPARGCAILAHVAAMPSASLCANRKYVLRGGRVDVAVNGATECDPPLAEALYQFCVSKVQRFESKARG